MEILGYLASVGIGVILGLLGGGGSILSIPILVYMFHIDAVRASAYSLFIVGVTSFIGAIPKYRDHLVNVHTGFLFGLPSIAAIFITRKWIVPAIPEIIIQIDGFVLSFDDPHDEKPPSVNLQLLHNNFAPADLDAATVMDL